MEQKETIIYSKKYYSEELKRQICQEHFDDGTGLNALTRKYNLSSHSLIHTWLRELGFIKSDLIAEKKIHYIGVDNFNSMPSKDKKKISLVDVDHATIAQLKKELEDAKLLAEAYKRMIEIAETDLKIPIRKKYNTK
jgi:transposase-like protein